jgi:DNA (cytosine-5)-methyltransferase 1
VSRVKRTTAIDDGKPPYRVPLMGEIRERQRNGYSVVSTFSGCGGSCLGFAIEGYTTLFASEFVPAAAETYRANFPGVPLDTRDIRSVSADEILAMIGKSRGEIDVLEGSPPCASFSTAGKREEGWNRVNKYSDTAQRVDDLFFEFVRILDGLQPRVFVAENVSGLVKGVAKGYFKRILTAMKATGYNVEARVLDAQWLGVPQMRQRVIFVGVRNDLDVRPAFPVPLPYRYSVRDALPDLAMVAAIRDHRGAFGNGGEITDTPSPTVLADSVGTHWIEGTNGYNGHAPRSIDEPSATVQQSRIVRVVGGTGAPQTLTQRDVATITHPTERRKFTIAELRRICAFPDDFELTGTYSQQWERLGRAVPPVMMAAVARVIRDDILRRVDER